MELDVDINYDSLLNAFRQAPRETERGLFRALINIGNKVTNTMRSTKRYVTRSGSLERATGAKINRSELTVKMGIPFDPTNATITKSGESYGVYISEGHGTWAPDGFVENGVNKEKPYMKQEIEREVNNINRRIF